MVRNILAITENENTLFYVESDKITNEDIKKFYNKVCNQDVTDIYEIPQNDLQYYCIDGRVWIDTPQKVEKLLSIINS